VDVCPNCRGIWLDAGELEHILRRYRRTKAPSKVGERAGDIAGGIAGEAAGAVFEFIGELIWTTPSCFPVNRTAGAVFEFIGELIGGILS